MGNMVNLLVSLVKKDKESQYADKSYCIAELKAFLKGSTYFVGFLFGTGQ